MSSTSSTPTSPARASPPSTSAGSSRSSSSASRVSARSTWPGSASSCAARSSRGPSSLHPTIGVHSPLRFDLVDRRQGQSLGGFTYRVVHEGGRAYDTYPVNAAEAESRRAARFQPYQTSGAVDVSALSGHDSVLGGRPTDFPTTLDLRRFLPGRPPGREVDEADAS